MHNEGEGTQFAMVKDTLLVTERNITAVYLRIWIHRLIVHVAVPIERNSTKTNFQTRLRNNQSH